VLPSIKRGGPSLIGPQDKLEKRINENLTEQMLEAQQDIKRKLAGGILDVLKRFDRGEVSMDELQQ